MRELIVAFLILTPLLCRAEQPASRASQPQQLKSLSLEQLGNVQVVTETKEPTEVWDTPAAIFVLTQEDIRRSGVTSVPDALRLVPGVNVARVSGSRNWAVGIRGLADQYSKYVLVLIDGRSVYSPLFGGVLWTINNVMLEDIDRIEVIRGPGGTIWGSDAVNGVINIITKPAKDTQGLLASAGGGSLDEDTEDLRYGARSHDLDFRVYGFGFVRGAEYHQDGQPNYDWSRFGQLGVRADWKAGRDDLTCQGDAYLGRFGDAQSLSTFTPPASFVSYAPTDASGGNVLGRWRRDLANHADLYLQAFWAHDYRIGSNFGETRDTFDIDFLHRTAPTHYQQFTYGVGARVSPSTIRQVSPTDAFYPLSQAESLYSGFAQEDLRLIPDRLSFTAGSKLERNNYTGFEVEPNARLLYTPRPTESLWASISRAVRVPDRVDEDIDVDILALQSPLVYAQLNGNNQLHAERLTAYEAGYRALMGPHLYFAIAGFHNVYNNLIAQGPGTLALPPIPPFPPGSFLLKFKYENGIHGRTDGFELAPDWQPASWWRLKAAYSYLHVGLEDEPGFTDTTTLTTLHGSSPNSQVALRSQIDLPRRFEFDQTFRYVGALPAQQVRAYETADGRLGYHPAKSFDLSVVGQNLLQPHHGEFGISPEPNVLIKRGVYAKIVWTR
jgi:iron complex outermembrane recepter protein